MTLARRWAKSAVIIFVAALSAHLYAEPSKTVTASSSSSTDTDTKIANGVLSVLLAFLVVIALLSERKPSQVRSSS